MSEDKNTPNEPGYYWVRLPDEDEFFTIARITGRFPFYKIGWAEFEEGFYATSDDDYNVEDFVWGPKIEVPSV